MGLIPILLIVVIILLLTRSKGRPFRISKSAANVRDPIRLILLIVVVLLLAGLLANLVAPLGTYRLLWIFKDYYQKTMLFWVDRDLSLLNGEI